MKILIDTHFHYYRLESADQILAAMIRNLESCRQKFLSSELLSYGVVFTDRSGGLTSDDFITDLKVINPDLVTYKTDFGYLIKLDQQLKLYVISGKQLISIEGIEVLSLFNLSNSPLDRHLEALDLVKLIITSNSIPVIPWSPGKWLGKRGRVIRNILRSPPEDIFVGDISLRPKSFRSLKKYLPTFGKFKILAGSDPLPILGDSFRSGKYVTLVDLGVHQVTRSSLVEGFKSSELYLIGNRDKTIVSIYRWLRNWLK